MTPSPAQAAPFRQATLLRWGMQGHGGADYGYRASMFFVEGEESGYGYDLMADVSLLSEDLDFAWYLAIDKGLEALLLEECAARLAQIQASEPTR